MTKIMSRGPKTHVVPVRVVVLAVIVLVPVVVVVETVEVLQNLSAPILPNAAILAQYTVAVDVVEIVLVGIPR